MADLGLGIRPELVFLNFQQFFAFLLLKNTNSFLVNAKNTMAYVIRVFMSVTFNRLLMGSE